MAMILDAFASSLSEQLMKMMKDEAGMLLCASSEIEKLRDTLNSLKKFLTDAEKRHITETYAQEWVSKLKDAMYDATDITDIIHLKEKERCTSLGCSNSFLFCLKDPLFAHTIGSRMKALNQKMDELSKQASMLNFSILGNHEDYKGYPLDVNPKTTSGIINEDVVGEKIEEDMKILVEVLTNNEIAGSGGSSNNVMVVSILGVGGIGKTTLAKKIFNDQMVQDSFDTKIWLSVTQHFNEADILLTAIAAADGHIPDIKEKSLLEPVLIGALRGKKLLLVMDDMWTEKAWEEVLRVPIVEACARGTRVLVTTRNEGVSRVMKAVHSHNVTKMGLQDAWTLLKKQVALSDTEIEIIEECGMKIAEKCDGLPLAIKVVGGVLCKKNATKNTWEEVLRNHIWSKMGLPEELNKAIYLSYEDLAPNLKQCFVYYSLFPKGEIIGVDKIVSMWIAEGFIGKDDGYSTHADIDSTQSGVECYKELVMRNLIEPQDDYYNQQHCVMHDVVRSFAQYVARDEALVVPDKQNMASLTSSKFRRLSITSNEIEWRDLEKQHSLRTLLLLGSIKIKPGDSLRTLPYLRTLHVRNVNFSNFQDSLCHLKHLRYLELMYTDISALPHKIGRMNFLEHIGLRGCHSLAKLPSSIVKLENLRYLSIDETKINVIPNGFRRLKNLVVLWGFPVHVIVEGTANQSCSLEHVGPLSQLGKLKLKGLENVPLSSVATLANLGTKNKLTCLELWCTSRLGTSGAPVQQEQIKEVFDQLRPPSCLEELTIGGYFGDMLPVWVKMPAATFLKSLRRLDLQELACCIQLPEGLGQLPNLDCLVVNHAPCIERIGYDFFFEDGQRNIDDKRSSIQAAFPNLHELHLQGMTEWTEWAWEKHVVAMPILCVLHIGNCKLSHLPPGLPYQARFLKRLAIASVQYLNSVEDFSSVVNLEVYDNPNLERILNLPNMQCLTIVRCPRLMLLEGMASLRSMQLGDDDMKTLPDYLRHMKLRQLEVFCSLKLLTLMSNKKDGWSEWEKIGHIMHVKGFARENRKNITLQASRSVRWYLLYTRDPYTLETNITNT